ncbi:expressed unknown protein [Seminavis robusta]|uniref:Uncharacterized protein n=1 Tax=Seminavis robusta TaxID=568900 RepID=A0A9N8EMN2_9STRA|nr:expressed unknown protein [Seminavis robusta]|eukprot:Sro1238_g255190.1 n/a (278) ;mRNA; f:5916-6749
MKKPQDNIVLWQLLLLLPFSLEAFTLGSSAPAVSRPSTPLFRQSDSKWDHLDDEDGENDLRARPDMKYVPRNVQRQHQNFVAIRDAGGKEMTHDVYVPEPDSDTFWFVGKVARISDVTVEQAVARQWPLIVQHAANLRPIELYPSRARLELWVAPGDSELDVAYNRPDIVFTKMEREGVEGAQALKSSMIGFQGEVYTEGQGMGFRTMRTREGLPVNPEIQSPEAPGVNSELTEELYSDPKFRAPSAEELELLQNQLKDKNMDISDLYEEQQRREAE